MKSRNREINIFNLSMMDVISGAMGAFLILVVVLSRYYQSDPTSSKSVQELEKELLAAKQILEEIERSSFSGGSLKDKLQELREAKAMMDSAQQRMNDLKDRLDQSSAQLERLRKENARLEKENIELSNRLPYAVGVWWDCPNLDIDLYLEAENPVGTVKRQPPFDPRINQVSFYSGDMYIDDPAGPGADIWLVRDAPRGYKYSVFYKIVNPPETFSPCMMVGGVYTSVRGDISFPQITLTKEMPWTLVGFFEQTDGGNGKFREATAQERQAMREKVEARIRNG